MMNGHGHVNAFQDALREMIQAETRQAVREEMSARKKWLTKAEVMRLTGWSSRKLQDMRDRQMIGFSQHAQSILYDAESLEQFLMAHYVKAKRSEHR
jgi:hypothetical protein